MAQVHLEREEVEDELLPPVCMACGTPATERKSKNFSWYPSWVAVLLLAGLLPYLIVALVLTKRMRVGVPFCQAHRSHWTWRTALVWGSLVAVLVLGIGSFALAAEQPGGGQGDLSGLACAGVIVGLIAWVVLAMVLQYTSIRPVEITDTSIKLTAVSPEFARALEEERERLEAEPRGTRRPDDWEEEARRPFRPGKSRPPQSRDAFQPGDD